MLKIAINVHGCPSESNHTWSELVLKIFKMWYKETLSIWSDLVDNSVILSQDELKFIVVHLELVFLKENNFGTFWDVDTDS
jgi:hypothetical protein